MYRGNLGYNQISLLITEDVSGFFGAKIKLEAEETLKKTPLNFSDEECPSARDKAFGFCILLQLYYKSISSDR